MISDSSYRVGGSAGDVVEYDLSRCHSPASPQRLAECEIRLWQTRGELRWAGPVDSADRRVVQPSWAEMGGNAFRSSVAVTRSAVSNPSVKRPEIGARRSRASQTRP